MVAGGGSDSGDTPPSSGTQALVILPKTATLPVGVNVQYRALAGYTDGRVENVTGQAQWVSSNPHVVTVSETGIITTVSEGRVVISASLNGSTATAEVIVKKETTSQLIAIDLKFKNGSTSVDVPAGTEGQLIPVALMNDGTTFDATEWVTFVSNNPAVVNVDTRRGYAYSVAPGSAVLTAQYENIVSNQVRVKVIPSDIEEPVDNPDDTPPVTVIGISVSPKGLDMTVGDMVQFEATATFSDGKSGLVTNKVTWSSQNKIVAVSEKGMVSAQLEGTGTVTASYGPGLEDSAAVNVKPEMISLKAIEVSPANATLSYSKCITAGSADCRVQYSAMGIYSNGESKDITTQVEWSSDKTDIVSIDGNGLAQLEPNSNFPATVVTISAKSEGKSASASLSVE